jgi:hypothetical protein
MDAPLIEYQRYQAELAAGVPQARAGHHLHKAYQSLLQQADRISDPLDRQSFLENVAVHQEITQAAAAWGMSTTPNES